MIRDSKAFRSRTGELRRAYSSQFAGSLNLGRLRKCCARKSHAVECGSGLQEGQTEVTSSILCTNELIVLHPLGIFILVF